MSRLMRNLATVNQWNDVQYSATKSCLQRMFDATGTLFSNIYIPVKKATQSGQPEDYTWEMIGYTTADLAQMYATYFGENFLVEAFEESDTTYPYSVSTDKLYVRCDSVVKMNKQKYMKLIELMGYEYNPLWNVDGKETYTYLENSGVNDVQTTREKGVTYQDNDPERPVYNGWTDTHTHTNVWSGNVKEKDTTHASQTNTNSVSAFDGDEHDLVVESQSKGSSETQGFDGEGSTTKETTYNNRTDSITDTTTYGYHKDTDKTKITHNNAKNYNDEDYAVGKDAFGNPNIKGGDKYHTEARVREGNIGVTKTQELIANERENLKFAIIMEFFKDLNEQVLVGIY